MEVHFRPEIEKKLNDVAAQSGQAADELVQDVIAGYLDGLAGVRDVLDSRYDDLKSGRVKAIDGEAFFESLRKREDDLLNRSAIDPQMDARKLEWRLADGQWLLASWNGDLSCGNGQLPRRNELRQVATEVCSPL